ncbi:MAG TPA: PLP-dependent transferase [Jatrophihabitantaceae bacterium]|nr:PLP-dependent transferase [Jatrophihabitantaceae bacterium]
MDELRVESIVVAAGRPHEPGAPLSVPPLLNATFRSAHDGTNAYLRNESSDSVRAFEQAVGALEGGTAIAFASGMAAIAAVVEGLPSGSTVVGPVAAYSGTISLLAEQQRLGRATVRSVDITDTDAVIAALPGADLLWVEALTNPLLGVPDLPALFDAARTAGVLVGVDATFATPVALRALDLGADVVMHSATKFLGGHSDLLMGVLVVRAPDLADSLTARRRLAGAMPGALECFLALRGVRTLAVRMERAQANAIELAVRLAAHPAVTRVRYPGLPSDPGHERASRQQSGFGAVISFEVTGAAGDAERACQRVELITHATSLGGVESIIERRARYDIDAAAGCPPTLLRLSVGIEHVDDLWADLTQALAELPSLTDGDPVRS